MQEAIDLEQENKEIRNRYRSLLRSAKYPLTKEEKKTIRKAFDLALDAHKDQRRKSGEPYIYHPIAVAQIVARDIGLGHISIVCGLLHDVVEDSDYTLEDIERLFGEKVARIIDGLTKISGVFDRDVSVQAENFRKMLLTLSDDVRVILIKLSDRLHNMRTLESMAAHKQRKIASETLYIYAPLAHRLGLYGIKTELEDLGLKYTEPEVYEDIQQRLIDSKQERVKYIQQFSGPIRKALNKEGIEFKIKGRPKSIFSIRRKTLKQGISFDEVYDKFAIRIIVHSDKEHEKSECWKVYSIITDFYKPNPDRLRDWISTPRANGYESLHTTVMGPKGHWVEVQIRSERMDEVAEVGYAAHWRYKENGAEVSAKQRESQLEGWINKIRELLENPEANALDFIDDFKLNLFSDEVFVFTPNGDLRTLPKGATALDFAFDIHTEIGARCLGAKVNAKLVPLSYQLKSGDQIEILTSIKQKPKEDWMNYVFTAKAKTKIKNALKEEKKAIAEEGKEILIRKLKHLKVQFNEKVLNELTRYFNLPTSQEVFYQIGTGIIDNYLRSRFTRRPNSPIRSVNETDSDKKDQILVFGDDEEQLQYKLSKCCNPIAGDDVFGFLTINEGIKVHRVDCPNALRLQSNYAYRIIKARWVSSDRRDFLAILTIKGIDRSGLVNELTRVISNMMKVNIKSINISGNDGIFSGNITVAVHDTHHLEQLIEKVRKIDGVRIVSRSLKKERS
jgi:guanosine-3',5'-bis(diphosphate) 3'-pyrophosphohydrolase